MMEQALVRAEAAEEAGGFHSVDTSIVLFFLAMELAASAGGNGLDLGLSLLAIAAFAVLPYFLPGRHEACLLHWLGGRTAIASLEPLQVRLCLCDRSGGTTGLCLTSDDASSLRRSSVAWFNYML